MIDYRCFLLCTHHVDMTAHTSALTNRRALRPLAWSYHQGSSGKQQVQTTLGSHWQDGHPSSIKVLTGFMVA